MVGSTGKATTPKTALILYSERMRTVMPVKITDTCNCMNCAHLDDHYWMSATMHIIRCRTEFGVTETRTFHALDTHWCPRWTPLGGEKKEWI